MPFQEVVQLGGCAVGLLDEQWVAWTRGGEYRRLEEAPSPGLVTLMEDDPMTFRESLVQHVRRANLDESAAASFPLLVCIKMGLNWPSDYWQSHALRWVEALNLRNDVYQELERLITDGRTQRIRHLALRLAR